MWLFTSFGFFSVVLKQGEPDLTIRSRARGDLLRLQRHYLPELSDPVAHEGTDYPWRARCGHDDLARAMPRIVKHIDYANYKDEVALSNGKDRAHRYAKVWQSLYGMNDDLPEPVRESYQGLPWSDESPVGKKRAFGGVVVDTRGRVLLREVEGHYDGYVWSFAKGRPDIGESPRQAALREVKEEMGVDARILLPLPSSFTGGTTQTQFFLMVVDERSVDINHRCKETSGLCWALPHEAERLISQTINELGRERDLMVLAESIRYLPTSIPLRRPIARREDWGFRPMPAKRTVLNFQRIFTPEETAKLVHGFIPQAMEHKWCAYFEDGVLRIHRSWSGFEIFRLHMLPSQAQKGHWEVVKTELNRHPDQSTQSDQASLESLAQLIQDFLSDYEEEPSLPLLTQIEVVDGIVRAFGSACLDRFGDGHASEEAKQEFLKWTDSECNRMNTLFLGYDPETEHKSPWPYQRGIWNTADQLGTYLRIHFVPSEDETRYAVRDAFMSYAVEITTATTENDGMPIEEWGWMLDGATEGLRDALLGINQDALDRVL